MKKSLFGFTLIELMIAIAVVGMLAAIAYPSYRSQLGRSNRAEARNALLKLQVAQESFFLQYNRYATTTEMTATSGPSLGFKSSSTENGNYTLSISPTTPTSTYTATASSVSTKPQYRDTTCRSFSITEIGTKTSLDSGGSATGTTCWR